MENTAINNYRSIWKNQQKQLDGKLSESEIQSFMKARSRSLTSMYKKGLFFDITLKVALALAGVGLICLSRDTNTMLFMGAIPLIITIMIVYQTSTLKKISNMDDSIRDIRKSLEDRVRFYYSHYIKTLFVSAFSGSLVFLVGTLYYLQIKYKQIVQFQWDDYLVLGLGLIIGFAFNLFFQLKYHRFQIEQMEKCLKDMDELNFNESTISGMQKKKHQVVVILLLAVLLGIIIFGFLLLN